MPLPCWAVGVLFPGSVIMFIFGIVYATNLEPICGTDKQSATFTIKTEGNYRVLSGNSCPGYDWTSQTTPNSANEVHFEIKIPLKPKMAGKTKNVGTSAEPMIGGAIGYALNGVPIYGPAALGSVDAIELEAATFDECAGHCAPKMMAPLPMDVGGYYHYHGMPGDKDPGTHADESTADFGTYCSSVQKWYGLSQETNAHSPLVGFMADGIPIYGPAGENGDVPSDLDSCNGHSGDGYDYYHYHITSDYPYTVDCMSGCTNGEMNSALKNDDKKCTDDYDYSDLEDYSWKYGGDGSGSILYWWTPTLLMVFGALLFGVAFLSCCAPRTYDRHVDTLFSKRSNTPMAGLMQQNPATFSHVKDDDL